MTCAAVYRANKRYTVFAVDGRITDDHGTIFTDRAQKWCVAGPLTAVFAGDATALQATCRAWIAAAKNDHIHSLSDAMRLAVHAAEGWTALVFDSSRDELSVCDSDGSHYLETKHVAAIGCGAEVALGYILAHEPASRHWARPRAKQILRAAIRASASRNCNVSARSTVLLVETGTGAVRVRG